MLGVCHVTTNHRCNHFGGWRCVKRQLLIQSHTTRAQWACCEAANSAVVAHCEALRAHPEIRRPTSVHITK